VLAAQATCDLRECNFEFLFRYHIFPPRMLTFCAEWEREKRDLRVGDTIALQAQVPPAWGFRVVFGVRVVAVFRERNHVGFRYRTLVGHPEAGENEFSFVVERSCDVIAAIHTQAGFSLPLARLLSPVFTRPYVRHSNRCALAQMTQAFAAANPGLSGSRGTASPRPRSG
jgi:hypothetical protein